MKKIIILMIGLTISFFTLNAFVIVPNTHSPYSKNNIIDIKYLDIHLEKNELILTIELNSEKSFCIVKDLIVADNKDFENPLTLISGEPCDNKIIYHFEINKEIDTIFVKPPLFYSPEEIESVVIKCKEGEKASLPDGSEWFTIESVDVIDHQVHLLIIPDNSTFPRLPHLVIGRKTVGSTISMNINPENIFDFGEIVFDIPADFSDKVEQDILDSYITINNAMFRINDVEQDVIMLPVRR